MGRLLALAAVVVSLVAFIAEETGSYGSWIPELSRAGQVLVVLAIAAALLSARTPSALAFGAQGLAALTAVAFVIVALVKYYDSALSPFGAQGAGAFTWVGEAELFGLAALAFGLTVARGRSSGAMAGLAVSVAIAVGGAIYAITLSAGNLAGELWWSVAEIGAFIAASAAATLERRGVVASRAPVAGGAGGVPGSDPGVE